MIKAVLIDDERNALDALENVLAMFQQVEIVGKFTNPLEALQQMRTMQYNTVFLDMEMPRMKGLEVAEAILELPSVADIVFVTAYDQYAVEAFEVNALDYLLKPVKHSRLTKTISKLLNNPRNAVLAEHSLGVSITCFGSFQLRVNMGTGVSEEIRWRTYKTKELFAYLVHHRGQSVHKAKIIEDVLPDIALDKVHMYLHTCVYQIRKLIKQLNVSPYIQVQYKDSGYSVQLFDVMCDVDALLNIADDPHDITATSLTAYEQAVELYSGGYLAAEDYAWSMETYEQLQFVYKTLLDKLATYYLQNGQAMKAIKLMQQALVIDPLYGRFHELMLSAYAEAGNRAGFIRHYDELVKTYEAELGMAPDEPVRKMFEHLSRQLDIS